jgi:hypothetical protein
LREVLHGYVLMPQGFALLIEFADDHVDVLSGQFSRLRRKTKMLINRLLVNLPYHRDPA